MMKLLDKINKRKLAHKVESTNMTKYETEL
jgi:hypothetical protein